MIECRRATKEDIDQISTLEAALFPDAWTKDALFSFFDTPTARSFVGILEGKVICYALCTFLLNEGEVLRIGTLPAYRRQGLAKALLSRYLEEAKDAGTTAVFLEVREQNLAARSLYESIGFSYSGKRKNYYSHPKEDAVLYQIQPNKEAKS